MADAENVTALPPARKPLPESIEIREDAAEAGLTPRELRELKEASGLRIDYLMSDEADYDEKSQLGVFIALRRAGYEPTWEEALDVRPVQVEAVPDPTNAAP